MKECVYIICISERFHYYSQQVIRKQKKSQGILVMCAQTSNADLGMIGMTIGDLECDSSARIARAKNWLNCA